jgi:DNA-binding HxlR family transcriptional regulator
LTVVTGTPAPLIHRAKARRVTGADRELIEQIEDALELLHGKWKVRLIFLMARGVHRHCRLLECLPGASKKMMTDTLRALEWDGLVTRRIYPEVPLRVEYSLSPLGWAITEPLMALAEWQRDHAEEVRDARSRHGFAEGGQLARRAPAARGSERTQTVRNAG